MILCKLGLTAWAAVTLANFIKPFIDISPFILCLIFGIIAREIGFVEEKPLNKSGSFGILLTGLMAFVFAGLAKATPSMLAEIAIPLAGIIILGVSGMALVSMLIGKRLGYTKEMSFAVALTALYGFPPNYILTEEASKALAETDDEKKFLMDQNAPQNACRWIYDGYNCINFDCRDIC